MKKIDKAVSPVLKKRMDPKAIEDHFHTLCQHFLVQKFIHENPDIPSAMLRRSMMSISQFVTERENCNRCQGLDQCPNMMKGHYPVLKEYSGYIDLQMHECSKLKAYKEEQKRKNLIQCHQIPLDIQHATFETIDYDEGRDHAINLALDFCMKLANKEPVKGLYFSGAFGVGKSYIAGAIANTLAHHGIGTLMMHMSALASEMRESIPEKMVNTKVDALSNVPILVLDDIGSENLTPWLRDDVLSVVFHNRASKQLPTIFTSNLALDELEDHFAYTFKNGKEPTKAARIMERIRPYVYPVYIEGKNRRYNN